MAWNSPCNKSEAYYSYLQATGLRDYRLTPGNKGVCLLRKTDGKLAHFITLTFWQDAGAIRKFAGQAIEKARYYSEDEHYLNEKEEHVSHYEILELQAEDLREGTDDSSLVKTFFQRPVLFYK
ncbi:MAG: hypothetical protein PVF73_12850 [Bacteroidales bacterium]|jgi:heme-degrading monooxygenase HmoA